MATPPLDRGQSQSKIRLDRGDGRRDKFKERAKSLERGKSSPAFFAGSKTKGPLAPLPLSEGEAKTVGQGLGHEFLRKTYFQPTYCHHCTELLWGLKGQGLQCTVCNFVSHEKCIPNLRVPCRHVLAERIQDPVAHQWTKPMTFKKKVFCNVCRKKISGYGVICEVCKYYAHAKCQRNGFNNCKQCATYTSGANTEDRHHWIEGNLPSGARCEVCTKSCSCNECLTSFRCGWCGIAVHSGCLDAIEMDRKECTYRDLWHMILVPKAITHRMSIRSHMEADTPAEEDSPVSPPVPEDDEKDGDDEEDYGGKGRPCLVIDGRGKSEFKQWRKSTIHPIYLSKTTTAAEILSISLRKCGISDDPEAFYLADVTDTAKGEEHELSPSLCLYSIPQTGYGPLRLYLRHRPQVTVKGALRVNNSQLETPIKQVTVNVDSTTYAADVVKHALVKFDLEEENAEDYCLVEVSQVQGVRERVVNDKECPWQNVQDLRKDSLTLGNLQRYYVRHREGGLTVLFIGGVQKEILKSKEKYTEHVKKLIAEAPQQNLPSKIPYERIRIGPAFPIMGGLFLEFPTFELAMRISAALEQSAFVKKVIMLPTVYPDIVNDNQEPLLVFVNGKSGGNQGVELLSAFRRHLNPHQIYDLASGGPLPGLFAFRSVPSFRIMIGGGDGTFGWVLGALQEVRDHLLCKEPPCALLPLGTGNDLARALKWGAGYSGEKIMQVILSVEDADPVKLDRWDITFTEDPSYAVKKPKESRPILDPHTVVMNNYFGVGLDAAIALDFHLAREERPEKFSSRFHNKNVYLKLGLQKMISKTEASELHKYFHVIADGKPVDLPEVEGIVFLNIQSWGAGADAWGTSQDPEYQPAAMDDGLLEVVGIGGVVHMGQIQSGIRNGVRIAQAKEFRVEVLTTIPVQVDGEAWPQPPGFITIKRCGQAAMLQGPEKKFFSKAPSKKEMVQKIEWTKQLSEPSILLSGGISSRRSRSSQSSQTPDQSDARLLSGLDEEEEDDVGN